MPDQSSSKHILIITSPYYKEITDELVTGATAELNAAGATYEIHNVPGALEIPQALIAASNSALFGSGFNDEGYFQGAIVLGCVIRGETSHYDIVAGQSAELVQAIAVNECIPVGNGILTVENKQQAIVRASTSEKNKGRDAANACLKLIELNAEFRHLSQTKGALDD